MLESCISCTIKYIETTKGIAIAMPFVVSGAQGVLLYLREDGC